MEGYHKTERFSVSMSEPELANVDKFVARKGVTRNEFLRRAALAFIRCEESGFRVSVKQAWEDIGEATMGRAPSGGTGRGAEAGRES